MKPIIGIITRPEFSSEKNKTQVVYEEVRSAIASSGGCPIGILPINTKYIDEEIYKLLDYCDGIVFQGGDDFTQYELECMKYVHEKNIPTLGICLGMQLMGYFGGGEMVALNHFNHKKKDKKYVHNVFIKKCSKLYDIFREEKIRVNSRHKDTIINTKLDVVAISSDGLIEAVEDSNKKFFLGVQWHPESMTSYDILESRLFNYFVSVCRK